ncbi:MAG: undecaprenyl-diphosphate phosphatase [Elusimicrobiota bacterium]|jgi:undecaprenyl-diphosphatase|nr:undecaprenyl-diphosphate phosphatase [Elusimicrobiota bacterium]
MTVLNAVLLGIIQAAGEFLPISSSAHLALFSFFFGGQYQGLAFDVALHLATLAAVAGYFWRDILALAKAGLYAPKSADGRLFWYIGIASMPAAVCGYFLAGAAEHAFRNPLLMAALLIVFGALLMFADRRGSAAGNKREVFTLGAMLLIGCAQALALAPGVSRAGITITAALLLGFGRAQSAKVSFFLSMPVIAGAAVLEFKNLTPADINAPLAAGFLAALICGLAVIKFLMKYIQTRSFDVFVYYRWLLGAAIIAVYFWRS